MLGELGNKIKSLFVKSDGSVNWRTVVGLGAGAALGGMGGLAFLGLEGVGAVLAGSAIGLGGATLVGMAMPERCGTGEICAAPGASQPAAGNGVQVETQPQLPLRSGPVRGR